MSQCLRQNGHHKHGFVLMVPNMEVPNIKVCNIRARGTHGGEFWPLLCTPCAAHGPQTHAHLHHRHCHQAMHTAQLERQPLVLLRALHGGSACGKPGRGQGVKSP